VELNRRDFLKLSGAGVGAAAALAATNGGSVLAAPRRLSLKRKADEKTTICCYCAVGCGAIATTYDDGTLIIDGDPDHPINRGTLCSKGQALLQMRTVDGKSNPNRLTKPLYRRPGGTDWEEINWDEAINQIADRIKKTRDENWLSTVTVDGKTYNVNRTDAICNFGGGELDNEECYLLVKMARALGLVYVEHCARI